MLCYTRILCVLIEDMEKPFIFIVVFFEFQQRVSGLPTKQASVI